MIDIASQQNRPSPARNGTPATIWVAHRGGGAHAPENTLAAFRQGLAGGARYIEGDFRLTADGKIIACHDASTQRTTGTDMDVATTPLATLQTLDAGHWFATDFTGESLPSLDEVLSLLPQDKGIYIEVKSGPELIPVLAKTLEQYALDSWQTVVIAFDPAVIRATRALIPQIRAYWLYEWHQDPTGPQASIDTLIHTAQSLGAHGLDLNACAQLDLAAVQAIRAAGLELHVYTVNSLNWAIRCQALEIDSITSDRPDQLAAELDAFWEPAMQPADDANGYAQQSDLKLQGQ